MEREQQAVRTHVVCFTHNEHSHIRPMFALAHELASHGLQITCALPATSYASYCTTNNINPSSPAHNIAASDFIQVQPVGELAAHSSNDIFELQKKLKEGLIRLMGRLQPPPSFLIADGMYLRWAQDTADSLGVVHFAFFPFLATSLLVTCHLPELLQKGLLPFQPGVQDEVIDFIPGLMKGFRVADIALDLLGRNSAELEAFNFLKQSKDCAGLVLPCTSYALEAEAEALRALVAHGVRVYPLAPMLHKGWHDNSPLLFREDDSCLKWLDSQPSGSVVYASFGSIITPTKEEITELALGMEACGHPFLWAIRGVEDGSDVMSALPPGFLERINNRGCIVSWVPQMAVLSHPSVGCFLCHCGLSSVLEAIWTGVPMIAGFYKISEQNTVFKIITDGWGVAVPLDMCSQPQAPILRKSIEEAIKEVLHGKGVATAMKRRNAKLRDAMREAIRPGGVSRRCLEQFMDVLLSSAVPS